MTICSREHEIWFLNETIFDQLYLSFDQTADYDALYPLETREWTHKKKIICGDEVWTLFTTFDVTISTFLSIDLELVCRNCYIKH